jgi:flavorubredoxin
MTKVLIVYHSLGGNTRRAAMFVAEGVKSVADCEPVVKSAAEAGVGDLLGCGGIAVGSPDYFSYMSGMVKDFFDRTYYPTQGQVAGKPCAIFVTHGGGGRAVQSVKDICKSFKFMQVAEPALVVNSPDDASADCLRKLGQQLARVASTQK